MYDTSGTQSVCHAYHPDYNVNARLSWLASELARGPRDRALADAADREAALALSMENPRAPREAYAALGALLGLLPPAAMFGRFLSSFDSRSGKEFWVIVACVVMNAICVAVGRAMGLWVGGRLGDPRRHTWHALLLLAAFFACLWGVMTGAAGGVLVFGIGAAAGAMLAVPVALAGFLLFAPLHRLSSHGGMIEARHLRPLALGVAGAIAALILSPSVFE
jgi:hypothetical protein